MSQVIYNVTLGVSNAVHEQWVEWMKREHIPEILQTGLFTSARLLKVHSDHLSTPTYAVQYLCDNIERYEEYMKTCAPALQAAHQARFGEYAHAIRTVLEILEEF